MKAGNKNTYDCIKAFSETDFSEDLKKFDIPTLIIHGDDDQIVPIGAAALKTSKIVKNANSMIINKNSTDGGKYILNNHIENIILTMVYFMRC